MYAPRTIEWDGIHGEWRCRLDDCTTLVAKTLQKLGDDLDWIDHRNKERQDVVFEQDARRSHTDR